MPTRRSARLLGALCLCVAPALRAQPVAPRPVTFGVMGGLSSATLSVEEDDGTDTDRRNGFAGGAYLTFGLAPQLGLRIEALYAMKGASARASDGGSDDLDRATIKLDYVEVPLLLQFQPAVAGGVQPRLYGGPALAFTARCKLAAASGDIELTTGCDAIDGARENLFKSTDVGGVVGGELAFGGAGRPGLAVGVRYTHGFTNISDVAANTIRSRVLGVYGAIELPLGR